jgi:hypothetical protein
MKQKVINIYEFSELQPAAQHKAIQDYINSGGFQHMEADAIETLEKILAALDIYIFRYFIDVCSNNNAVYFQHGYSQAMNGPRLATWLNSHFPNLVKDLEDCKISGLYLDANFAIPLKVFLARPTIGVDLTSLINPCIRAVLQAVYEDFCYQRKPENFRELADANNWYFTERGEITAED